MVSSEETYDLVFEVLNWQIVLVRKQSDTVA
jgi:hypothetical protein